MLPTDTSGEPTERTPAQNQTVGNVFVISPDKKIKLMLVYPMATGWNFNEVLRAIDSLQLTARHRVATPVNWRSGDDVIIAGSVSNADFRAAIQPPSRRFASEASGVLVAQGAAVEPGGGEGLGQVGLAQDG